MIKAARHTFAPTVPFTTRRTLTPRPSFTYVTARSLPACLAFTVHEFVSALVVSIVLLAGAYGLHSNAACAAPVMTVQAPVVADTPSDTLFYFDATDWRAAPPVVYVLDGPFTIEDCGRAVDGGASIAFDNAGRIVELDSFELACVLATD